MHRFIMNCPPGKVVDHINGNTLDNRKENLRICEQTDNMKNRRLNANNASGFIGVEFRKSRGKWIARCNKGGERKIIGTFDSAELAALAYDNYCRSRFGDFSKLNFPERHEDAVGREHKSSTGFTGVYLDKRRGVYQAQVRVNGIIKSLGYFKDPNDADAAVRKFKEAPRETESARSEPNL